MDNLNWNRCDECGRYIKLEDFVLNKAIRKWYLSHEGKEQYTTLCPKHKQLEKGRW